MNPNPEDTIAAISTPPGEGGIGIVRLSGPGAIEAVARAFVSSSNSDIRSSRRRVFHGEIWRAGVALDEVLVHVMRAPRSYTREDVVEINCHGGALPVQSVLECLLETGARLAAPGEFTQRAFLNGRIDLVQAEAVIDRIRAQTGASLRAASEAAQGRLSREIRALQNRFLDAKAYIEAAVDFPDDDLPELITPQLREQLAACAGTIERLLETAREGRLLREGASVAIAGRPNVGKSSVFNALLRENRAIVTASAGTTRDLIEERANVDGIPIRLTDMAGLRETKDEVERLGVERARSAMGHAMVILFVLDVSGPFTDSDRRIASEVNAIDVPVIAVLNKIDLVPQATSMNGFNFETIRVSALTGEGINDLEAALAQKLRGGPAVGVDAALVTRVHQRDSLRRALDAANRLVGDFDASPEFLSMELEDAIRALGEITGETTPDDILERIFASFCIGK